MAVTIATFVNSTAAPYTAGNLNPKRQRLMRLLAKALYATQVAASFDYSSSVTRTKALITDAAIATRGMTQDQVNAATIATVFGASATGNLGTLTSSLSLIRPWLQLDEATLGRMELLIDYYLTGQT